GAARAHAWAPTGCCCAGRSLSRLGCAAAAARRGCGCGQAVTTAPAMTRAPPMHGQNTTGLTNSRNVAADWSGVQAPRTTYRSARGVLRMTMSLVGFELSRFHADLPG